MNNRTVFYLVQAGVLGLTSHTLDIAHAYKVVKFRNTIKSVVDKVQKQEMALFQEVGIEDPESFNSRLRELQETDKDSKECKELSAKGDRFRALQNEMMNEDVDISDIKAMPYDEWYKLCQENKDIITADVEDALLGVLWKEPEE